MIRRRAQLALASVLMLLVPLTGSGRPGAHRRPPRRCRWHDALREADSHAFANRIATAATRRRARPARLPLKGILPSARVEGGVVRTTDPIGAFGTTLRQRLVTPAAFDPRGSTIRTPSPTCTAGSCSKCRSSTAMPGRAGGRPRRGRRQRAPRRLDRHHHAHQRRARLLRRHPGRPRRSPCWSRPQRAADAAVRQVQSMVQQGLVTKADALQASVRAADVTPQLLGRPQRRPNGAATARRRSGPHRRRGSGAPGGPARRRAGARARRARHAHRRDVRRVAPIATSAPMCAPRRRAGSPPSADRQRAGSDLLPAHERLRAI